MNKQIILKYISIGTIAWSFSACVPSLLNKNVNKSVPNSFNTSQDSTNSAKLKWKEFFKDSNLVALIDTALSKNQELNIIWQEISMANNEIKARKGKYLPFLNILGGASLDKTSRYTRLGALDANTEIESGKSIPTPLTDFLLSANVSWQVDIWKQLRNNKKSAVYKFLSSIQGKNFMVTNLVAEIVFNYYELMALDNQLEILKANIEIQENALRIVTLQKTAGVVTELAVKRFQAEVLKNQSRLYYVHQKITETENRINFLTGRFPQPVLRNSQLFNQLQPDSVYSGIPSQLLANRPDIQQAELELAAAHLDVKVAKANFYPVFNLVSGLGFEAFNTKYLLTTPTSIFYNLAGGLVTPLVNRNAIKADYLSANARQIKSVYRYEQTILKAYTEVMNQIANRKNLAQSFDLKTQQVEALTRSVNVAINLFKSARADYVEVLLTQREALESKIELIEIKKQQMTAMVKMYQVLGGGWK
jgi:outer membrane protein, multidrug efflux system